MTEPSLLKVLKSSVKLIGLFCLLLLVSSCQKAENPDDVTILFWTALAEDDLATAQSYSTEGSEQFFNTKKVLNASCQIGKVNYENNGNATVETYIRLQSSAASSFFNTYLVKDSNNQWKVDYSHTLNNISEQPFRNVLDSIQETGSELKSNSGIFISELGRSIVTVFKNLKDRLLE
jgi:hypothetical protein